ncbi:MAG: hypothetical protein LR008_02210 [Candidatus Pacebacteria bacterium]|nr:hypothetical protein [Candidatus Paceibacterota bacterium]
MFPEELTIEALIEAVILFSIPISKNFGNVIAYDTKSDNTPVSVIDTEINASFQEWSTRFKNLGFIGEEGNGDTGSKYLLLVDPLDGTEVFLRGIATCTTIATILVVNDNGIGTPLLSVIYSPLTKEVWYAENNKGAYKISNGNAVRLSTANPSDKIRTAICAWPTASHNLENISKRVGSNPLFSDQQIGALGIGGALIAQGTLDATVCGSTSATEMAAMTLLVREAGGVNIDLDNKPITSFQLGVWKDKQEFLLPNGAIVAANQKVADSMLSFIRENRQSD